MAKRRPTSSTTSSTAGDRVLRGSLLRGLAVPPTKEKAALFVNVDADQLERFKALAEDANMTLREWVTRGLESFAASQATASDDSSTSDADSGAEWSARRLNSHSLRIGELEKRLEAAERMLRVLESERGT